MKNKGINLNNYEAYILDYIEGKLDPIGTAELLLFFEQHPDLKEEMPDISQMYLRPEPGISFGFCEALRQPSDADAVNLNTENYDHYFIAAAEGDLSPRGMDAVGLFIAQHPGSDKEFNLYKAARLKANPTIQYQAKNKLRKPVITGFSRFIYTGAAAAVIILMISVYLKLEPSHDKLLSNATGEIETPVQPESAVNNIPPTMANPAAGQTVVSAGHDNNRVSQVKNKTKQNSGAGIVSQETSQRSISQMNPRLMQNTSGELFDDTRRSFFTDLYDDIRLSQEIMIAGLEPEQTGNSTEDKSLVKFKTSKRIGSAVRSGAQIAGQLPDNINGWMLADIGISGLNLLTGNDLKLQRNINQEGKTENIRLTEDGQGYSLRW